MKTINKILLSTSIVLLPLAIFAKDNVDNHKNEKSEKNSSYNCEDNDSEHKNEKSEYLSKNINYSFEGTLEKKPKNNFNGLWMISGVSVLVDDKTLILRGDKKIKVGDEIEIDAKRENGKITALVIEKDDDFFN